MFCNPGIILLTKVEVWLLIKSNSFPMQSSGATNGGSVDPLMIL